MNKSMADQVAERERELLGDDPIKLYDSVAALDLEFIKECYKANERGDGLLLAAILHNKFLYVNTRHDSLKQSAGCSAGKKFRNHLYGPQKTGR
ncbi:MAG: hypothetical protein ABR512_12440 [Desulfopila sp.]